MSRQLKQRLPAWVPVVAALIVPGSGYVLLGYPSRGLQMLFFMGFLGFVTFNLTDANISPVGRLAGGVAVWALSVVEVVRLAGKKPAPPPDSVRNQS